MKVKVMSGTWILLQSMYSNKNIDVEYLRTIEKLMDRYDPMLIFFSFPGCGVHRFGPNRCTPI